MDANELDTIHNLELKLLDEFDRVCKLHGLTYMLAYGSCLGAVRHAGFIPWDDDLDVFVFASDIERIRAAMQAELSEGFFYQCGLTDPEYRYTIDRIRLSDTTALEEDNLNLDINQGVWMDIQPLTEASPHLVERWWQKCWAMVNTLVTVQRMPYHHGRLWKLAAKIGLIVFDNQMMREYARKTIGKYIGQDTGVVCTFVSQWQMIKRDYSSQIFEQIYMKFEGRTVPIPAGYDEYLTLCYGDYLTIPPENERASQHTIAFFDPYKPYTAYKGKKYLIDGDIRGIR